MHPRFLFLQHIGRPQDEVTLKWFKALVEWLESESGAELYTLTKLYSKMVEFSNGDDVYTIKRLKQKLQEHYKEHIFFAKVKGRENIVCFKNMAKCIITEKWQSSRNSIEDEAAWIVSTAAKIIRDEIQEKSMIANLTQATKTSHLLVKAVSGFLIIYKLSLNLLLFQKLNKIALGMQLYKHLGPGQ